MIVKHKYDREKHIYQELSGEIPDGMRMEIV